jgi:glycosyltransferase involved in cell wall biosynthesis
MKIAIVHSFYKRATPSGENAAVLNQIELLEKAGHEILLVSAESDEIRKIDQLNLAFRVATFGGMSPLDKLREFNPDIVHIHNLFPNYGQHWLRGLQIPHVFTLHNFRPLCAAGTFSRDAKDCFECPVQGSHKALIHKCYKGSTIATLPLAVATRNCGSHNPVLADSAVKIVLSQFSKDMYLEYYSSDIDVLVLPNFAERTSKDSTLAVDLRTAPWVYIGRLSPEKGVSELLSEWPESELLHIYGAGELEDNLHKEFGHKENIVFQGSLDPSERATVLLKSRGLIFPSVCRENSPLVIGEAYSAGTPVIAFVGNVVGLSIAEFGGGDYFESFSQIGEVLKNYETKRAEQAILISELYESLYSPEIWLKKLLDIYTSAISKSKSKS